jgi:hypothetical protein
MKRSLYHFFILILLASTVSLCQTKKKTLTYEEFQQKASEVMGTVRSPGDVAATLEMANLDYKKSLINPPENYTKYTDKPLIAAANIGAYIVDASYQHVYRDYDGAFNSYTSAQELAKTLGIEDAMWDLTFKRQAFAGTQDDEILDQLAQVIIKSEELLEKNEKPRVYVALLIGNYVEKMHILLDLLTKENKQYDEEIRLVLSREIIMVTGRQLSKIDTLLELIEVYKTKEDPGFMAKELAELKGFSTKFFKESEISKLTPDDIYTNPLLYEMYKSVRIMRDYIINPTPQ